MRDFQQFLRIVDPAVRVTVLLVLIVVGWLVSRALVSIACGLLLAHVLVTGWTHRHAARGPRALLWLTLPAVVTGLSGLVSTDLGTWSLEAWQKLPLAILPVALWQTPPDSRSLRTVRTALIALMVAAGLWVLANYALNFQAIQAAIGQGRSIPVPNGQHVRFSLLAAVAAALAAIDAVRSGPGIRRHLLAIAAGVLFALVHVLAVRTGLVALYAMAAVLLVRGIADRPTRWPSLAALVLVAAAPVIAYKTVPSVQKRIAYMRYDLRQMQAGEIGANVDGRRLRSWQVGRDLVAAAPVFGYGAGDLARVLDAHYQERYPDVAPANRKYPHNQFLFTALEFGLVGTALLVLSLVIPFLRAPPMRNAGFTCVWVAFVASMLVETTLEGQIGMTAWAVLASVTLMRHAR